MLPPLLSSDLLENWLREDLGRGDCTTQAIFFGHAKIGQATWIAKRSGCYCWFTRS
jgi:nicotinate-nucleotide pyrophosphorylase (carboxylating)